LKRVTASDQKSEMVAITSQSYKQRQAGRNNHCKRSIPLAAFATISFTMMIFSPFKNYTTTPTVDPALTAEIAQSTPIHGHLHKSGMLDPKAWHLSYGKYRRDELLKWVEQRDSNSTNNTTTTLDDGPLRPPVVFNHYDLQGCPVYFNQKYKFIYLRTPKVGSTSVLNYFKECTTADHNKATGKKTETTKQPEFCLEKLHLQQHLSLEYLQEMWKEYYVFAFSRNIYQRAVSQYRFLVHFLSNDANHCPQVSWNMYCKNPLILGDVCRRNPQCCPHPPKPENHWTQYFHVVRNSINDNSFSLSLSLSPAFITHSPFSLSLSPSLLCLYTHNTE